MSTMLSVHFSLEEAVNSQTASRDYILNSPDIATLETMRQAANCMEKVRALLSEPISVNSWYRSLALNRVIGSRDTSQHIKGEAIDFICPLFGSPLDICKAIIAEKAYINFDQLILEHTWVHISFAILSGKPRNQVLSLLHNGSYATGLTDALGTPYK